MKVAIATWDQHLVDSIRINIGDDGCGLLRDKVGPSCVGAWESYITQ